MRLLGLGLLAACSAASRHERHELPAVGGQVAGFVERQLREHGIPGAVVAVLDRNAEGERRWQEGFGAWRPDGARPMPGDAVLRVASISKLFTATAAMVLVERGVLDLDAPVQRWLPEFAPVNPFGGAITLRHLLGHRAGLVREAPVGHYFTPDEPTLLATVASVNQTELVHAPGSAFKYSNPGLGVVGEIVARATGKPFEEAVRELVLEPLDLRDSDFAARADLLVRQARGVMWTYDGRAIPTPEFAFGYGPAANLRTTAADLCTFAASWFPEARMRVLRPESQASMWVLPDGATSGCGLGFFVRDLDGHRMVGHGGAVYGFASSLLALPEQGIAVAVVLTKDFANDVAEAIAERALRAALANRAGTKVAPPTYPVAVGQQRAQKLAGHYRVGQDWVELYARGDALVYDPNIGVRTRMRVAADGALVSDDVLSLGSRRLTFLANGNLHDGREEYVRDDGKPAAPPAELLDLLGEYGWDHDVLVVYEDRGQLGVLIEWVVRDLPERIGPDRYRFNPGMYTGDTLAFERDANGKVAAAVVGGARFVRRPDAVPGGFRITPRAPIANLRAAAAEAAPPRISPTRIDNRFQPSELVDLAALEPSLKFDLVYATANNFLGTAVYPANARAKLQRPAAEALVRVHRALATHGYGLLVFDAYRPWHVTKVFWDATPDAQRHFVADPSRGSRHNRGCAVDLTLYDLATGQPVEMPSGFDEFTPRAYPDYPGGTSQQRWHRELLRRAMEQAGFTVYEHEWWHFDYATWPDYAIGNEPL
jgi:D-alanyl-D-alanine dipeptidase/CubicO group peptidase (beta-lactamase class C family)